MLYATWAGILVCLFFSASFSGLTLGYFGLNRLKLEVEADANNKSAIKILELRRDSNFLLTSLLWGNVSVNCLLTLLSNSIFTGVTAFVFSTFGITLLGEIFPQAYFSRNALKVGVFFVPIVKLLQLITYPVSKPTSLLLDRWLGKEGITFFKEEHLKIMLQKHMLSKTSDIGHIEGTGAVNFLTFDDIIISDEGEIIDPESIISLPDKDGAPNIPEIRRDPEDSFLQQVHKSGKKWVVLTDFSGRPALVMDADGFLRDAVYKKDDFNPYLYCHKPIVIDNKDVKLGQVIKRLKVYPEHTEDDVIDHDLILYWGDTKRIITGADILGRLVRGIVKRQIVSNHYR